MKKAQTGRHAEKRLYKDMYAQQTHGYYPMPGPSPQVFHPDSHVYAAWQYQQSPYGHPPQYGWPEPPASKRMRMDPQSAQHPPPMHPYYANYYGAGHGYFPPHQPQTSPQKTYY